MAIRIDIAFLEREINQIKRLILAEGIALDFPDEIDTLFVDINILIDEVKELTYMREGLEK